MQMWQGHKLKPLRQLKQLKPLSKLQTFSPEPATFLIGISA